LNPQGRVVTVKTRASAKKFPGGGGGATEKTKPKNRTIKLPSTLSISCMKIQGRRPWLILPNGSVYKHNEGNRFYADENGSKLQGNFLRDSKGAAPGERMGVFVRTSLIDGPLLHIS